MAIFKKASTQEMSHHLVVQIFWLKSVLNHASHFGRHTLDVTLWTSHFSRHTLAVTF